jgi:hypothetical protein
VPTVHVVLVDAASGRVIGEVDQDAAQLPETFAVATRLQLGDSEWQVESAEPPTRAEAAATARLRLVLRQIHRVDPRSILYSLPTLENEAPPTGGPVASAAFHMHEDDWRQIELVAARFEPEIGAELAAIRSILDGHRKGPGFTELHVRQRIPAPLAGVTLTALGLPGERPVAIGPVSGPDAAVIGGFAHATTTGTIYGRRDGGVIVALGLEPGTDPAPLAAIARAHDLVLVDWCRAETHRL